MKDAPKFSIRKIGILLIVLVSIFAVVAITTNIYTRKSFESISKASISNYELSNNFKEMDLPLKVIANISAQEVEGVQKEEHFQDILKGNLDKILVNGETGFQLIERLTLHIENSNLILPTNIKPEKLQDSLEDVNQYLGCLMHDIELIQERGSLHNSDYTDRLSKTYESLLVYYDDYFISYLEYEANVRDKYTMALNVALSALIIVIISLIMLVFRLINTDMRLIEKAYNQIENHDFNTKKVLKRVFFLEERQIQHTIRKFFDNQRVIEAFQKLVSKQYVIDDIIDYLLETVHETMGVDRVGIAFYDEKKNLLITEYGVAVYETLYLEVGYRSNLENSSLKEIINSKRGQINNDLLASFQKNPSSHSMSLMIKEGIRSNMSVPLMMNNEVFGIVFLSSRQVHHFTNENYKFAENLLYEITGVLNRSYLMKVFIMRMTHTIARLVDKKDIETGEHISRMVKYSTMIASNLNAMHVSTHLVDNKMILAIERNAAVHDIGKVATPDNVLKKPGRLTPEEFEVMKEHASVGGDVFRDLNKELEDFEMTYYHTAEIIARYHHERWDGSGYPEGLKGFEIPIEARIVAVADVFDALSSKRVYKEALSFEKSLAIIQEESGKHFDPVVVEAFMYDLTAVKKIYDDFREL